MQPCIGDRTSYRSGGKAPFFGNYDYGHDHSDTGNHERNTAESADSTTAATAATSAQRRTSRWSISAALRPHDRTTTGASAPLRTVATATTSGRIPDRSQRTQLRQQRLQLRRIGAHLGDQSRRHFSRTIERPQEQRLHHERVATATASDRIPDECQRTQIRRQVSACTHDFDSRRTNDHRDD